MTPKIVRDVHMAINLAHRFVYFVPEAAKECATLGIGARGGYFGIRVAPLGAASNEVIVATFYNFSPRAVAAAMPGVWETTTPEALQAARFCIVGNALSRIEVAMSDAEIAEARAIIDPVVAGLDLAGKPLAAGNAAIELPDDPLVALWQQITVVREWRGDAHIAVLGFNEVGPCDCNVLQVGSGRAPMSLAATRQWSEEEWSAAIARLAGLGWVEADGRLTDAGAAARDQIELDTDRLCTPIWNVVGDTGAARFNELISPIHDAMAAAGTYTALV